MVGALTVLLDIAETAVFFAAPALLWLFAYLLAYSDAGLARSAGFDRATFWLIVPGAFLGEFANVLFFGFHGVLLAVNVGGGLIPTALSVWLLNRVLGIRGRALAAVLGTLALGAGAAFLAVVAPVPAAIALLGVGAGLCAPAVAYLVQHLRHPAPPASPRRGALALVAIFGGTGVGTFLTTSAVPGTGIVSDFPVYLLLPVAVGIVAVAGFRRWGGGTDGAALAVVYAGVTLGELVGADVLHQPPLYGPGASGLYAIGGAGLLDLLHLSGLLALAGGVGAIAYARRRAPARRSDVPLPSSPIRRIRRAYFLGRQGEYAHSVSEAQRASREAVAALRSLAELPEGDIARPWQGIPVPPWVAIDQANLDAAARSASPSAGEAYRSWLTARALVGTARSVGVAIRPSAQRRGAAFAIDLGIVGLLATAADLVAVGASGGTLGDVVNGLPLNGAVVGTVGWGLLYFVGFEATTATTPGKRFLGLKVRPRAGGPNDLRALALRNLPRIVPLTLLAYGIGLAVAILTHPGSDGGTFSAYGGPTAFLRDVGFAVGIGLTVTGLVSGLTIGSTEEGQRLGDLVAGTWVVREEGPAARARAAARSGAAGSPPAAG